MYRRARADGGRVGAAGIAQRHTGHAGSHREHRGERRRRAADDVAWIETVSKAIAAAEPAERLQCLGGTNPRDNAGVFDLDPHAAHFASVRVGVVTRRMPSGAESIERVFEVRFTPEGMPTVEAIERVIGPTENSTQSPHGPPGRHAYRGGGLRVLLDLERGAGTAAKVTAIRVDNQGPQ
jgi:hypothetical protein